MTAAEDQGWQPRSEAQRVAAQAPRLCSVCAKWTDHFADGCPNSTNTTGPVAVTRDSRWCGICNDWTSHSKAGHEQAVREASEAKEGTG